MRLDPLTFRGLLATALVKQGSSLKAAGGGLATLIFHLFEFREVSVR